MSQPGHRCFHFTGVLAGLLVGSLAGCGESTPAGFDLSMASTDAAQAGAVRFVAVGDTGKGNAGQQAVADAMAARCQLSGCDFALLLGDNIYENGASSPTDPLFQSRFEVPYAGLDLPFYVTLGNHDYGGAGIGNEFGKPDNEVAYTALSNKWKLPARTHHFTQGMAELFSVDTNAVMWGVEGDGPQQLAGWLAGSNATWKIVFGHHMYRSNGPHGNAGSYDGFGASEPIYSGAHVKSFLEQEVCGKADLYLCGHDHSRQWLEETCQGTELAVSGAGASATPLGGSNAVRFEADTLGFLYVTILGGTLTAEFIDVDGAVEFTRTLTK